MFVSVCNRRKDRKNHCHIDWHMGGRKDIPQRHTAIMLWTVTAMSLLQDLLTVELRRSSREAPYPDRLSVHRKGKPGQQEEEPLAHELRCWSNIPQVPPLNLVSSTTAHPSTSKHCLYLCSVTTSTKVPRFRCHTGIRVFYSCVVLRRHRMGCTCCIDGLCFSCLHVTGPMAVAMQADQIHLIALQVQRKYYSEPNRDSQRWISRHDQLHSDKSLPKQELPATMLSMDYTRVWYTDKCVI